MVELTSLIQIRLEGNSLRGQLPPDLGGKLTSLRRLDLSANEFTGTIDSLVPLPELRVLHLEENDFVGTIPSDMGNGKDFLRSASFHDNDFTGSMPESMCDIVEPLGNVEILTSDCAGPIPSVVCVCCTECF
mmetsp:Transcript_46539/g.141007  ORF Transcript_46539/g.141007 Transcript_46539/m.141007 type:complete len:132 (-) Transcript_46539:827-1222(-)